MTAAAFVLGLLVGWCAAFSYVLYRIGVFMDALTNKFDLME